MVPRSSALTSVRTICVPSPDPGPSEPIPAPSSMTSTVSSSPVRVARTMTRPPRRPSPCSTAFATSSVSTTASDVATSAGIMPNVPSNRVETLFSGVAMSAAIDRIRPIRSSKSTVSSMVWERVSWTTAIVDTLRCASASALLVSGDPLRRAWSRSSAETVWRLFFTRWWISRIVASFVISSRSRSRSSETSRTRIRAPFFLPYSVRGIDRSDSATPRDSTSVRHAARPVSTSGRDSSTGALASSCSVTPAARSVPTMEPCSPRRWNPLIAFGLAYTTTPSGSSRTMPSPTRGRPRRAAGADLWGNSPRAIIPHSSSARAR